MKLARSIFVVGVMVLTAGVYAAETANSQVGTWKLNEAKSKVAPGGYKNQTVAYSDAGGGMLKLEVTGVGDDGKSYNWSWKGKFDGKAEKVTGSDRVDMMAITMNGADSITSKAMKGGKQVATTISTVAKDRKSRTSKTTRTDASGKTVTDTVVYDKAM